MKSIPQSTPVQFTIFSLFETKDTVTCLICFKKLQTITLGHLRTHGLTINDYKAMFPGASFASQAMRDKVRVSLSGGKRPGITKACEICKKPFYVSPNQIKRARFCSRACTWKGLPDNRANLPPPRSGANHPQWRGGRDKNYYGPNWHGQRRLARKRDNHTCQKCGKAEQDNGRKLDVHHIIDFREFGLERYQEANQLSNLTSLCRCCHSHITSSIAT